MSFHPFGGVIVAGAPTVNDDNTRGFNPPDAWFDSTTGFLYFLTDGTTGAAVWERFSASTGSLPGSADMFDWDGAPSTPPPEVEVGDILTFEFQKGGPIRKVIGATQYPVNRTPAVDPLLVVTFFVTTTGAGNANVVLRLNVKYIAIGELGTKANDETLTETVAVIDTLNELHQHTFTLDKTKITLNDYASFSLERIHTDAADTYTGRVGVAEICQFEAGL